MRTAFVRLALRRLARKNPQYRADIKTLMRDRDMVDAFTAAISETAVYEGLVDEAPVLDFFKWLIEYAIANPEAIMAIIQMIIMLFAGEDDA